MIADAMLDCTHRGQIVLDPFIGSGSTLIAAERVHRVPQLLSVDQLCVCVRMTLAACTRWAFALVERAALHTDSITLTLDLASLVSESDVSMRQEQSSTTQFPLTQCVPIQMKRRGVEMRLVIPSADATPSKPDPTLIRAIARAHYWFDELASGRASTLKELAKRENIGPSYIGDALKLGFLAPDIIEKILAGKQPASLTTFHILRRTDLPITWDAQRDALGF